MAEIIKALTGTQQELTQEGLVWFLNFSRDYARKLAAEEQKEGLYAGKLLLTVVEGKFTSPVQLQLDITVSGTLVYSSTQPPVGQAPSATPQWKQQFTFEIPNLKASDVSVSMTLIDATQGQLFGTASLTTTTTPPLNLVGMQDVWIQAQNPEGPTQSNFVEGKIHLQYQFQNWWEDHSINGRGFAYDPYLPVLHPLVPMPLGATPPASYTKQDDMMKEAMGAIMIYWKLLGQEYAQATLPKPLVQRVDDPNTDEYFTDRRINGFNPGFIVPNPNPGTGWEYQIEWDLRYLTPQDIKEDVVWPQYINATFNVKDNQLVPYSIIYELKGKKYVQPNDGTPQWEYAKKLYMYTEVNIQFTWTHVGVHFDVEQYAMAIYRNLTPANPLWKLLTPHFQEIIYNDREVIRPSETGVVTIAGSLLYEGQMKMTAQRMKSLSWTYAPQRVLPKEVANNNFEAAGEIFWSVVNEYVDNYIQANLAAINTYLPTEIKKMSEDIVAHSLTTRAGGEKPITTIEDVALFCKYVIYQAIFYHAWVHWNSYDDFFQSLFFNDDTKDAGLLASRAGAISDSNMTQAFVTYASPSLRQWPILDSQLGTPDNTPQRALRQMLQKRAGDLQGMMLLGTYIMSPNT